MRSLPLLGVLRSTAAIGAVALGSATAQAECTRVNNVVTCTGANTTDQVNSAVNQAPPPSVSLIVAEGATVTRTTSPFFVPAIRPNNPPFTGAIGYTNSGIVGTPGSNVDFSYIGSIATPTNSFTFDNRGTQNGGIFATEIGGAINGTNSGTVTRGIMLTGAGPIAFSNSGTVFSSDNFSFVPTISLVSSRVTTQTGADGITRRVETGGPITATINGIVGIPASGTTAFRPQDVNARSAGGVEMTVNGMAGRISADARGGVSAFQFTSETANGTTRSMRVEDQRTIGADARVTIGSAGQVSNVSVLTGPGAATAIINGAVGTGNFFDGNASASANGIETTFRQTEVSTNGPVSTFERNTSQSLLSTGGAAFLDVTATGRVAGNAGAGSTAGSATARIAGQVGTATTLGQLFVGSTGTNSTSQSRFVSRSDGTFETSNSSTQSLSGGAALATITATGRVFGDATAAGDGSATVDNSGAVGGNVTADSNSPSPVTTSSADGFSRTIVTNAAGVRTVTDQGNSTSTTEALGGTASVVNRVGATIQGSVQSTGPRGATLDNAGTIAGNVFLSSQGGRTVRVSSNRTTSTSAPAGGGGTTTTTTGESTESTSSRPTAGAVAGTYSGTVGMAPGSESGGFRTVQQTGTTASTATVAGTLFADFRGVAGAQNRDLVTTVNTREVTQPNGSSTRERSSTLRETVTQIASTSSLTVGATGRISDNGSETGDVFVVSLGGNATFTLDGGQVDGGVAVEAAQGTNLVRTSDSGATFTRGPAVQGTSAPEVQQTQTEASTRDERQAPGTAIVTVNSGTIGGDLFAIGSGTGPGSLGANVLINGTVTGTLIAQSTGINDRSDSNIVTTRTAPNAVNRTSVTNSLSSPSENAGGVLVTVGGTVGGGLLAGTDTGAATVDLTGRVGSLAADGVTVQAFDFTTQRRTTTNSAGTSFFNLVQTSSVVTNSSTTSGGAATLNVAASAAVRAAGTSSIEGDILVQGFGGSALNVAAGSRIVQNAGSMLVRSVFGNTTSTTNSTFNGNGALSASTAVSTTTLVGGVASLNNAGTIGSVATPTTVVVTGIGGASVINSGTINGSLTASSIGADRTTTTTNTNFDNPSQRRAVTTIVLRPVGGPVQVNNSALVTGGITAIGASGTVTNSGVVRGGVTLGGGFSNFSTTSTTTLQASSTGGFTPVTVISPSVLNPALFTQTYTLNQNGLLLGGVAVTGATIVDPAGASVRTSNVNATVNLNNGSITLGNIVADANTNTNVNLNGSGFLGVAANDLPAPPVLGQPATGFLPTPSLAPLTAIDPALGTSVPLPSGSRVSGVQTLTKTGDGTFVIVGAPLLTATATAAPTYTLDVGTLRVSGGELQLGLAGTTATANSFGIRGNVENNANLVLGRRVTNGSATAVQGINLSVLGNVTNAAAGNLIVGINPAFVRASTQGPFVAFGPNSPGLASTNSFVRVDGNLNLAGTVLVQGQPGGLYEAGRAYDLFSVSGGYTNTGTVRSNFGSPFVSFTLTPRSEGGRTIVSLDVARASFDTVTTDRNSTAAAGALQANLPAVFAGIRSGSTSADVQDLATIVSALDTQLTTAQAAQLFRELSSGEFYGSLSAVSTTIPFGDATDGLPGAAGSASGIGLWLRPTGQFAKYRENREAGASGIDVDNHGGSIGLNYATGSGGHVGIAGGYGRLKVETGGSAQAEADTHMVGVYASQQLGRLNVNAQAVYGRSDWTASRALPLLGRTATSSFESDELRGSVRVAYTIAMLPGIDFSPFAKAEVRRYSFDGFTEAGAGAVSLAVDGRSRTVFTPELGARMSGSLGAGIRPFAEASYLFQGDVGSDRQMSFVGGNGENFTVNGVDPDHSIKGAVGVAVDVGSGTLFVRGDYHAGGDQQVGSVRGGLLFTF